MNEEALIVFVGHDATRTGAPHSLLKVVQWFAANTSTPIAVVLNQGGPLLEDYSKLATVHVWSPPAGGSWFGRRAILKALARRKVGAIFSNTGVTGPILAALRPVLRAPVISRIPELEAYMRKNDQDGSASQVLALSDHFVAVSESVRRNLVERHAVPFERVSVVYGACSAERAPRPGNLREAYGIPQDAFVVGGCGTMDWRKGVDLFIQVAHRAVQDPQCRDVYFCWIGCCVSTASCLELHYEVELLSLEKRLFFVGEVPDPTGYLADLDLFLLPSREDPFPLVMLEAARQGLPTVCFENSGGACEFVDDSVGRRVPMLDVPAMTQAVKDLRAEPERRGLLGRAAYEKSLAYTPDRMGREIHRVILGVMARSTGQRT